MLHPILYPYEDLNLDYSSFEAKWTIHCPIEALSRYGDSNTTQDVTSVPLFLLSYNDNSVLTYKTSTIRFEPKPGIEPGPTLYESVALPLCN